MSISLYSIYANGCIELARSIIIKSEATAEAMNDYDKRMNAVLMMDGEPSFFNPYDKTTWRYYMHMAGQYHRTDRFKWLNPEINEEQRTDKIKVYSLDTHEYIDFTIENLREHRATWREYQKGSTYYQNLVNKYPESRLLIDGILNPIDIQAAINAKDNSILYYDKRWVEENEYSLIHEIQEYIYNYYHRWDNPDYAITDNLYTPARIGILYIYLPYVIMDIRYRKSRTIEAHSFHVWNYLGSHQWLDEWRYHLNLYQRMWFYRNIKWSEINAGKLSTFYKHIDVIMTNRHLPVSEFHTNMVVDEMKKNSNAFYPHSRFRRIPLNMKDHLTKDDLYKSIPNMVDEEVFEARDNILENNIIIDKYTATRGFTRTPDSILPTKVIESKANDNSRRMAIKKFDVELNEWIYMTTKGLYTAKISVANPITAEFMSMTQPEALITFMYALSKANGIDPELIPTVTATKVLKLRKPSIDEIKHIVDFRITSPTYLHAADHYVFEPYKIISTEKFAEFTDKVWKLKNIHRNLYSFTQDYREHVQVKTITEQYYDTVVCQLTSNTMSYREFFKYKGWVLNDEGSETNRWNREHYQYLANEIAKYALGNDLLRSMSIKEIQGMMVRLLKKLSSYSIHFLQHINEDEITVIDWPYLRYGELGTKNRNKDYVNLTTVDASQFTQKLYHKYTESLMGKAISGENGESSFYFRHKEPINILLDIKEEGETRMRTAFRMPTVMFNQGSLTFKDPKETLPTEYEWDLDKLRIHKTTEDKSIIHVDEEGNLIVRGVVYVKDDYKDKEIEQ